MYSCLGIPAAAAKEAAPAALELGMQTWDNGKENGNWFCILGLYWDNIGIMEKKMETTSVYWGYFGIMEKKMETGFVYWGYIGITLG